MEFGIFMELSVPRPWTADSERQVYENALEQVRLADELGFDYVWAVEHHFLEEYSHCSGPDIFLSACAAQTKRIRVGHGVIPCVPQYQSPIRVAERAAVLDIISGGRSGAGDRAVRHLARAERVQRRSRRDQEDLGRVRPGDPQDVDAGALLLGRAHVLHARAGHPAQAAAEAAPADVGGGDLAGDRGRRGGPWPRLPRAVAGRVRRLGEEGPELPQADRGVRPGRRLRQRQGAHGQLPLLQRGRRPRPAQRAEGGLHVQLHGGAAALGQGGAAHALLPFRGPAARPAPRVGQPGRRRQVVQGRDHGHPRRRGRRDHGLGERRVRRHQLHPPVHGGDPPAVRARQHAALRRGGHAPVQDGRRRRRRGRPVAAGVA